MDLSNTQPASPPDSTAPAAAPDFVGGGFKAAGFKSSGPVAPTPQVPTPSAPTPALTTMFPQENKKGVGKNVVVIGLLVLVLAGLVAGFGKIRTFISQAQGDCQPEGLAEANLTGNSVEVVFQTGKNCLMEVAYGTSSEAMLLQVPETMASLNHRIRLAPLLAGTIYYYQVVSEGKKVGTVRSFSTKALSTREPSPSPAEGEEIAPATPSGETTEEPTPVATRSSAAKTYTLEDFQAKFGSTDAAFDLDKNGVVNSRDWLIYQSEQNKTE